MSYLQLFRRLRNHHQAPPPPPAAIPSERQQQPEAPIHRGVFQLPDGRWASRIHHQGQRYWLGIFHMYDEAVAAFRRAAMKLGIGGPLGQWPVAASPRPAHEARFQELFYVDDLLDKIRNDCYDNMFAQFLNICGATTWSSTDPLYCVHDVNRKPYLFIFETELEEAEVGAHPRLFIPARFAERYFPVIPTKSNGVVRMTIKDRQAREWSFIYRQWLDGKATALTRGWRNFVKCKKLRPKDKVLFYVGSCGTLLIEVIYDIRSYPGVYNAAWNAIISAYHYALKGLWDEYMGYEYYKGLPW